LPQAIRPALDGIALAPLAPATARARQAGADAAIQTVEVSGLHIRRTGKEMASPPQLIAADDLKKSAYMTVSEVLVTFPPTTGAHSARAFSRLSRPRPAASRCAA